MNLSVKDRLEIIVDGLNESLLPKDVSFDRYVTNEQDNIEMILPNKILIKIHSDEKNWCVMTFYHENVKNGHNYKDKIEIGNLDKLLDEIESLLSTQITENSNMKMASSTMIPV